MESLREDRSIQQMLCTQILAKKDDLTSLDKIKTALDELIKVAGNGENELGKLVDAYQLEYENYLQGIRKVGHYGIYKGALCFIKQILEIKDPNSMQQNSTNINTIWQQPVDLLEDEQMN